MHSHQRLRFWRCPKKAWFKIHWSYGISILPVTVGVHLVTRLLSTDPFLTTVMLVLIVSGWSQVLWNDCTVLRVVCREYELAIAHFQWLKLLHFCYHQLACRTYKARQQTQDVSQHPPLCPIDQLLIAPSTEQCSSDYSSSWEEWDSGRDGFILSCGQTTWMAENRPDVLVRVRLFSDPVFIHLELASTGAGGKPSLKISQRLLCNCAIPPSVR